MRGVVAEHRRTTRPRRGASAVEFAFVAPVIFLTFFGFWEWSHVEMLRQVSTTACFEAARRGTLPSATTAEMADVAQQVLDHHMVQDADITTTIDTVNRTATTSVSIPLGENSWGVKMFFSGHTLTAHYELQLETEPDAGAGQEPEEEEPPMI